MSQIPSNVASSAAQSQLSATRQAAGADKERETSARQAERQHRRQADNREFVEDMAAATGLKVDPDQRRQSQAKKDPKQQDPPPTEDNSGDDSRAHVVALLASPDEPDSPAPPPCIIDIEA